MSVQLCLPHLPKRGSSPGSLGEGGRAAQDAARTEAELELQILRIVRVLGLVLGIEVIEVAKKLVEAMDRGQELVAVAEMVLAELPGHIAERLEQLGERRILVGKAFLSSWQSHLQQARPHRALAGDECGSAGSARLLAVIVGEDCTFVGDAVDVGRAVAHLATIIGADVPVADVIAHDDENVGLGLRLLRKGWSIHQR